MSTNRPLKVFLCHSSADKPAVRELYRKLHAEPWIEPWLDEEELFPGMDWNMEIEKAIEVTDVILVCLSNNSITKEGYVQREIRIALDYADYKPEGTLFIIPIRLEECTPPKRLARWQYADYFEGQRVRALERLLVSLKRRVISLGLDSETYKPSNAVNLNSINIINNIMQGGSPKSSKEDVIHAVKSLDSIRQWTHLEKICKTLNIPLESLSILVTINSLATRVCEDPDKMIAFLNCVSGFEVYDGSNNVYSEEFFDLLSKWSSYPKSAEKQNDYKQWLNSLFGNV